jgi:predicted deacetylase
MIWNGSPNWRSRTKSAVEKYRVRMHMVSNTQYLLRFDDICPTMNWEVWEEIEATLIQRQLKPILAVVPDNRDPGLQVDAPAGDFWDHVRAWQEWGWTIALHGYQHRYVSRNAGLAARRKKSEFAGLPVGTQHEKLQRGMEIFERERITSRVWIAPGNAFDATTVALLPDFGINVISAGYFRFPYVCSSRIRWVPQQMYYFRPAPAGVWTVCYHHNGWDSARLQRFCEDLDDYGPNIASLDEVLDRSAPCECEWSAWLCTHPRLSEFMIRAQLKLWSWWSARRTRLQSSDMSAVQASH